jgi:ATP-dependent exoDNAse (exonuclease V) beta subunit
MGRFYQSPTNNCWYPSVTTVTGFAKKDFFAEWRKNPDNAKEMNRAARRGTTLHNITEKFIKNDPDYRVNQNVIVLELFDRLKSAYLKNINNVLFQEESLWSDYLKMAGRVDCVAEYKGELSIIDFKGSTKEKKEEWVTNYFEQTTCYSLMLQERTGIRCKNIVVLVACEDGTMQEFIKRPIDYVKSLKASVDNYWKHNDFDELQEKLKDT